LLLCAHRGSTSPPVETGLPVRPESVGGTEGTRIEHNLTDL